MRVSYTCVVRTDENVSIYLVLKMRSASAHASCNILWIRGLSTRMSPFYSVLPSDLTYSNCRICAGSVSKNFCHVIHSSAPP